MYKLTSQVLYNNADNKIEFEVQQQINYSLPNNVNELYFILFRDNLKCNVVEFLLGVNVEGKCEFAFN